MTGTHVNIPHPRAGEWVDIMNRYGVPQAIPVSVLLSMVELPHGWKIYIDPDYKNTWIIVDEHKKRAAMVYYVKGKVGFTKFYQRAFCDRVNKAIRQ